MAPNIPNNIKFSNWRQTSECCDADFTVNDKKVYCSLCNKEQKIEDNGYIGGFDLGTDSYTYQAYTKQWADATAKSTMPLYVCDDSAKLEPGSVINPGQVLILPDNGKWFITGIGSSGTA